MQGTNDPVTPGRLGRLFGAGASMEGPLAPCGAGLRLKGIDLCRPLDPEQAEFLLDALAWRRIVCVAGQDLGRFSLDLFERFANHWGAPVPHPNNFLRGGKPAQSDGDSAGPVEWLPFGKRRIAAVNKTFPGALQCLPHESPTVLVAANFGGEIQEGQAARTGRGGSWHTDIEYEPLPIYVSMFLAHRMPTARTAPGGTWVENPVESPDEPAPYFAGSDDELLRRRRSLPLNGETAYADTAAAFAALPAAEQARLEQTRLRRRLNAGDEGWLAPLVRVNPRSGLKSLHSPIWASRPGVRPPVEVEGLSEEGARALLDRLEAHVLQEEFRYDHLHVPGDVTIWDNYMTLHNSPPIKGGIASVDDARLLYRLSCKGAPAARLPRRDDPAWLAEHIPGAYASPADMVS